MNTQPLDSPVNSVTIHRYPSTTQACPPNRYGQINMTTINSTST